MGCGIVQINTMHAIALICTVQICTVSSGYNFARTATVSLYRGVLMPFPMEP